MSIQQLKELFGNQEAVLELVQLEGGELALRNAGSEKEPLVKIQFSDELKARGCSRLAEVLLYENEDKSL
ncbi:hypothetical protein FZ923_08865 [Acinetobacter baumannii]|nr:hypothetical protein FZ923_08865 [Acinetobacter baumannii]